MDWDHVRLHWCGLRSAVRRQWPLLTADDLDLIAGSRRYMIDVVQERYAYARPCAVNQVDAALPTLLSRVAQLEAAE
ncbi:MAG: general stress protein CsbD [Burkholderiales bacterium]